MHLIKIDDERIINLDTVSEMFWIEGDTTRRYLQVVSTTPLMEDEDSPTIVLLAEDEGGTRLWEYALAHVRLTL